jgi:hypothetical protein
MDVEQSRISEEGTETPSVEEVATPILTVAPTTAARTAHSRRVRVTAAAALVAVALVGAGLFVSLRISPWTAAGASPTPIGKDGAIAAVEAFLGRKLEHSTVSGPEDSPTGSYYEITETPPDGASAWVDIATGRVIFLLLGVPTTTTISMTQDQAQASAEAFFEAHAIPIVGLTATVKLEDHGESKFYTVTFQRYESGVQVPDMRTASVDPSNGKVFSFTDRRVAYGPVPTPKIGRIEAIRLATAASKLSNPTIEDVQLMIDSSPVWPGRLVWSVQLSETTSGGWVSAFWIEVDAITGEAKITGQG